MDVATSEARRGFSRFSIAKVARWAVPLVLFTAAGCVRESDEGTMKVFTYEMWVPVTILLGGLAAIPAGWFLRQKWSGLAWTLMIGGAVAAVGFAPGMFRDRATVDPERFTLRSGIWGLTAVHDVAFDDLSQITFTMEESRGRRGRKRTNYFMVCQRKDGTEAKVPLGNDIAEAAAPYVLIAAAERGLPIIDQTGSGL